MTGEFVNLIIYVLQRNHNELSSETEEPVLDVPSGYS